MIWEDNFYTILQTDCSENSFQSLVKLNESHPIYEGHFPNSPVVPGVCTLTIVKRCVNYFLSEKISVLNIKDCKFTSAIIPSSNCILSIKGNKINDSVLAVSVESNDVVVLKLKLSI